MHWARFSMCDMLPSWQRVYSELDFKNKGVVKVKLMQVSGCIAQCRSRLCVRADTHTYPQTIYDNMDAENQALVGVTEFGDASPLVSACNDRLACTLPVHLSHMSSNA